MSLTTGDLSLKGFASIDATSSKHDSFVTRALLAQIVEFSSTDDIVLLIQCDEAVVMYKNICKHVASVDIPFLRNNGTPLHGAQNLHRISSQQLLCLLCWKEWWITR